MIRAAEQTDIIKAMIGSDLTVGMAYGFAYGCTGSNIQTDTHLHLFTYLKVTPLQGMVRTTTTQRISLATTCTHTDQKTVTPNT